VGKPEEKDNFEDLRIDEMILLKCVCMKQNGWVWTGLGWVHMTGCCEHVYDTTCFIKFREFLDQLRNC
jgi:hypothetical protein